MELDDMPNQTIIEKPDPHIPAIRGLETAILGLKLELTEQKDLLKEIVNSPSRTSPNHNQDQVAEKPDPYAPAIKGLETALLDLKQEVKEQKEILKELLMSPSRTNPDSDPVIVKHLESI